MDFFAQQDLARRNTRLLLLLFTVTVAVLVLLTNALLAGFLWFTEDYNLYAGSRSGWRGFLAQFSGGRFALIGLLVVATVAIVSFVRWLQLAAGGRAIAEALGAEPVLPQTRDAHERRALNVVQEIALAAGMPVPDLYLLRNERGINAFAAGTTPADAVVAVTSGALHHLQRHELQGVVAHEFSHILNGDMRLNVRLAALLKGITFLGDLGYLLLHGSGGRRARLGTRRSAGQRSAALPLLGIGLAAVGWIGATAAGFIKAGISRQKEYLADAGAVQFTRDPGAIADALKVIGGYVPGTLVHRARAAELSHMFFAAVTHRIWQAFATHPPLEARIRRIQPAWDGEFIRRPVRHYRNEPVTVDAVTLQPGAETLAAAVAAAEAARGVLREPAPAPGDAENRESPGPGAPPPALLRHCDDPLGASALMLGLLIASEAPVRDQQLALVAAREVPGQAVLVNTLAPALAALPPGQRLPLVNRCLPALRSMSPAQYRHFKATLLEVIRADRRTDLLEWCLYQLLRHYLDPAFLPVTPSRPRYRHPRAVADALATTLSVLAHEGSGDAAAAFAEAAALLDLPTLELRPRSRVDVQSFSRAVHALADCYPLLKPRLLKAMAAAANENGDVCGVEHEIIACIAAVIDCPLPPELEIATLQTP